VCLLLVVTEMQRGSRNLHIVEVILIVVYGRGTENEQREHVASLIMLVVESVY